MLDYLSIPLVYFFITAVMLLSFEVGYQITTRLHKNNDKEISLGESLGGLMAMLAFVLGLTFSMANSQNNERKLMVIEEANEIGTAYLRTDLLDDLHGDKIKLFLYKYVSTRNNAVHSADYHKEIAYSIDLQDSIWTQVAAVAKANPNPNTAMMVQSANGIVDIHEKRLFAAVRNRIPITIWGALLIILVLTMLTVGVQSGYSKPRKLLAIIPLALAFAALATLIVDLDRPQNGLIKVDQESMLSLEKGMEKDLNMNTKEIN